MITQSSDHSSPQNGAVNTSTPSGPSLSQDTQTLWFATSSGKVNQPSLLFLSSSSFLWWWPWSLAHSPPLYLLFPVRWYVPYEIPQKTKLFSFCCFEKITKNTHTHAPQLCVVTFFFFFFDFGTQSRRLWGRSTSKTKEINKRWIVVELSFYWRSYSTTTRLFIYISMWWYLDVYIRIYLVGIYIYVPVITRY